MFHHISLDGIGWQWWKFEYVTFFSPLFYFSVKHFGFFKTGSVFQIFCCSILVSPCECSLSLLFWANTSGSRSGLLLLKLICFKGQRVVDSEMAFVLAVVEMSGYLSYCSTASLLWPLMGLSSTELNCMPTCIEFLLCDWLIGYLCQPVTTFFKVSLIKWSVSFYRCTYVWLGENPKNIIKQYKAKPISIPRPIPV